MSWLEAFITWQWYFAAAGVFVAVLLPALLLSVLCAHIARSFPGPEGRQAAAMATYFIALALFFLHIVFRR